MTRYRVGVDVGGTFTDIVLLGADGTIHTKKISSSVENYAQAIVDGLTEVFAETGLAASAIEEIRHGTTVASNAILEHKGARTGLITTKGFRDVLEIRTLRMPRMYDIGWTKPAPLVERRLRKVVDERINAAGEIERPLAPRDAERAVDELLAEQVEAIAVCLLHSFTNPTHELAIRDIVRRKAPQLPCSISCEVLPEIKEYERTSTTVINAYVTPIVAHYLRALRKGRDAAGIHARVLLMQSNGGLTTDAAALERPIHIIESGPAGALQVGPESAGASPGPVCYDNGGETPTVTDANLLLGYLNPAHLVGGALELDAESARRAFDERIAKPLGMPLERAAYGAHLIAASNMIRAIRAVSSERGRDPREFALFAFGGNGPVFACGMAQALGMKRIVVPPSAGLFSSFGLLYADVEHHYSRTFRRLLRKSDRREIERAWDALAKQALDQLAVEGFTGSNAKVRKSAALHYHGQTYELTVPLPDGPIDFAWLEEAFGLEHEKTYGHRAGADEPVELVSIQVVGQGLRGGPSVPQRVRSSRAEPKPPPPRSAY